MQHPEIKISISVESYHEKTDDIFQMQDKWSETSLLTTHIGKFIRRCFIPSLRTLSRCALESFVTDFFRVEVMNKALVSK